MDTLGLIIAHLVCDVLTLTATYLIVIRVFDLKTYHILQSYCFALIFKCFLKSYIGVPLNPWMMQLGWAIPSGHTVALGVMYGLLLDKKTQGYLYAFILFLIASTLIYCGYHNLLDVLIGLVCVWILVSFADFLFRFKALYRVLTYLILSIIFMNLSYVSNHATQMQYFNYMIVLAVIERALSSFKNYRKKLRHSSLNGVDAH
ncbi:MAG: hypothetical protein CMF41_05645 [Legionellales bacterium]|nr:hypothetical protein [Legionellales bacterium]OUX64396.1 MAG: hypothetical protein CBE41_03260 [Gammaproteobacteria bacterium TMED281]